MCVTTWSNRPTTIVVAASVQGKKGLCWGYYILEYSTLFRVKCICITGRVCWGMLGSLSQKWVLSHVFCNCIQAYKYFISNCFYTFLVTKWKHFLISIWAFLFILYFYCFFLFYQKAAYLYFPLWCRFLS